MDWVHSVQLVVGTQPNIGCMRVVILDPVAETRDALQQALNELPGFVLVGKSRTWIECESLLDLYLPELLITRVDSASPEFSEAAVHATFPVVLGLRAAGCNGGHHSMFETMDLPLDAKLVSMTIERVRTEIYRRKLDELSSLMQRYMHFSRGLPQYLSSLHVEGAGESEIPAERVMFIAAYGNYVHVHTGANVHEIRDTLSGMRSRLDPSQFARVHRSFVVNRSHVRSVVRKEGAAMGVLLSNGTEIPVGPNYRAEVDGFESAAQRFSA